MDDAWDGVVVSRRRTEFVIYAAMVALVAVALGVQTWQEFFSRDVYSHLAVLRELSVNPFDPQNPFVASPDPSYGFSPYTVSLGLVGGVLATSPVQLLQIGALLNVIMLGGGLWMFSRSLSPHRWTPHLTLLFSLVAWGVGSWRWSGYLSLNSIGFGLGYPSMFATGLALISLAGLRRYLSTGNTLTVAAVGIAAGVIGVTHPFTGMWFAVAAISIIAVQEVVVLRATARGLLIAALLALMVGLLWPYYPILELVRSASESSSVHAALYRDVLLRSFLMFPGFVAIVIRARRSRRDPLLWMLLVSVLVYVIGYVAPNYHLGRVGPLIALVAHVAMADVAAEWLTSGVRRRVAMAWTGIILVTATGTLGSMPGVVRMVPRALLPASIAADQRLAPMVEPYVSLTGILESTDVVLVSPSMRSVVSAVASKEVVGYLEPLVSDRAERVRDSSSFFSSGSSLEERDAIAERWGATHVVVEPGDLAAYPWLSGTYVVVARTNSYVVFSLR